MRRAALIALVAGIAGCGGTAGPATGGVGLVLDIPNAALDPKGYTNVEVTLHEASGDQIRSASLGPGASFDLGEIDPNDSVWVEATLRNDSGAAVGYGRTAAPAAFAAGSEITVPIRRPIIYFAGLVSIDPDNDPMTPNLHWSEAPATFSDLSIGTALDGRAQVGTKAVLMISAGPKLFMVEQATSDPNGTLTGSAVVREVSTGDHSIQMPLPGTMTGDVLDGAGTDDGSLLVIGTSTQLFLLDTTTGQATSVATGSFSRVAIVAGTAGTVDAIAINGRSSTAGGACGTTAELWWVPLGGGEVGGGHTLATGGFSDVAADRGHAYYVDCNKGELGEATATSIKSLESGLVKPTALAVSNGQAFIGVEKPGTPAVASLLVMTIGASDMPRTLWSEAGHQVVEATDLTGVQRELDASSFVFNQLEVGAGGDYIALTTAAQFHGVSVQQVNFPEMTIDTEEMRVFDASNGSVVQRYRSWCDGVLLPDSIDDILNWSCATTTGQSAPPPDGSLDHHISSLTFLFGKK